MMKDRWYLKRLTELRRLGLLPRKALVSKDIIMDKYVKFITRNVTTKALSKQLDISASAINNDFRSLGIKKRRCRKNVKPTGCCAPGYQAMISDENGNSEWKALGG